MPLNFGLGGKTYPSVTRTITADEIAAYAAASGDDNPRHRPGPDQVASPLFTVVPGLPLVATVGLDPELGVENPLMIVHGEEEVVHHRPIRPGDGLTFTPTLLSVEDKGRGATFVVRVSAHDPDGAPVNDQYATVFVRGGGSGTDRPKADPPADPVKGAAVAEFTSHVAPEMPARYAEASGDHNPIHLDDAVAKMVGLPGIINHGLGTLSLVAAGLVRDLAAGDPERLTRIGARFTEVVLPGSSLSTTVWEGAEGHLFETVRPDGAAVMTGWLQVAD